MNKKFLALFAFIFFFLALTNSVLAISGSITPARIVLNDDIGKTFQRHILVKNTNDVPINVIISSDATNIKLAETSLTLQPDESRYVYFNVTIVNEGVEEKRINFRFSIQGSTSELSTIVTLTGVQGEDIMDVEINAVLDPETPNAIAGESLMILATLNNKGNVQTNYTISIQGHNQWANLIEIDPETLNLASGESGNARINLNLKNNAVGERELIIKADYNGESKDQRISFRVYEKVLTDIAYILKDATHPDPNFISVIRELGYSYRMIDDSELSNINFSDYRMILVGDERINNIPVNNYRSLVANPDYYRSFGASKSSTTRGNVYNSNTEISITKGLNREFQAYTQSSTLYYLSGKKYSNAVSATGSSTVDLGHFVIAIKENPRRVFFGISKSNYWTAESRQLFKNSIYWAINGEDKDGDGYYSDSDCDDSNPNLWQNIFAYADFDRDGFGGGNLIAVCSGNNLIQGYSLINGDCNDVDNGINTNATEIPYDGIDQNCDGFDLADVDRDGHNYPRDCNDANPDIWRNVNAYADNDKDGFGTGEIVNLCIGNNLPESYSLIAGDCNDNSGNINPNATEIIDNINQNCRNDAPQMIVNIESIEWNEDEFYPGVIDLKNHLKDSEGDTLNFSISEISNNQNIIVDINNGVLRFSGAKDWNGNGWIIFKAEDSFGTYNFSNNISLVVNPQDDAPEIINKENLKAELNEDFGNFEFNLTLFKGDVDDSIENLKWKVDDIDGRFNATINNNILRIVSFQDENCGEGCGLMLRLNDSENKFDRAYFNVAIEPVNDAPVLIRNIDNITWNEDTNLSDGINLREHFNDVDRDELRFNTTGNINVAVQINNGFASFVPAKDFYGREKIIFSSSDGEFSINSNEVNLEVLNTEEPPEFAEINCSREILEDNNYSCELNATDFENDNLTFSVVRKNNLNCTIEGKLLNYISYKDYFGNASCLIRASDKDGFDEYLFEANISNINDAPVIISYSPENNTKVLNDSDKEFRINPYDIDNNITVSWILGNETVGNGSSYIFRRNLGLYNLTAIVSDGEFNATNFWSIFVGNIDDFRCSEVNGYICTEKEMCLGTLLNVYDTKSCCSVVCTERPPEFKNVKKRGNITNEVKIEIKNIESGKEFKTGELISIELNIDNTLDKGMNFDVDSYLYDITKEDIVGKAYISVDLGKGTSKIAKVEIKIPEEIKDDDDYAVFAMIHGKNRGEYYNEKYVRIKIIRKEHDVAIKKAEIEPEEALCGDSVFMKILVKNMGNREEYVYIEAENPILKINEKSGEFRLESYGEDGDNEEKEFNIILPESLKSGEYKIKARAIYNNGAEDYQEAALTIGECKQQDIEIKTLDVNEPIKLINTPAKQKNMNVERKYIAVIVTSILTSIMFVLVLFAAKAYRNNMERPWIIEPIIIKNKAFNKIKKNER